MVVTLALGVGANSAMVGANYELIFKPLPYRDADRLVAIYETTPTMARQQVALANLVDWRAQLRSFSHLAGARVRSFGARAAGGQASVTVMQVGLVTADFLPALGAQPRMGRLFDEAAERSARREIVLTHKGHRRLLPAGAPMPGATVFLNEQPYIVIAVLPEGYEFPIMGTVAEAYIPLARGEWTESRSQRSLEAIGRIRPGVSREQAETELHTVAARIAGELGEEPGRAANLQELQTHLYGTARGALHLLLAAGFLLLLIACCNVANLLIAEHLRRDRDVAIRMSLGASARQLIGPFAMEAAILCSLAGVLGIVVAHLCLDLIPELLRVAGKASVIPEIHLGRGGLVVTISVVSLMVVAFTLLPLWMIRRVDIAAILKGVHRGGRSRLRARTILVISQIALSTLLLLDAGLLTRSFLNVLAVEPGFDTQDVLVFGIGLPSKRYDPAGQIAFHRRLAERLRDLPGAESVASTVRLPLRKPLTTRFRIDGSAERAPRDWPRSNVDLVSPDYFRTLHIPVLAGRGFTAEDREGRTRVLLVSAEFARTHLAGRQAVGARVQLGWRDDLTEENTWWEIVGVVGDIHRQSLERAPEPQLYLSMDQCPSEGAVYLVRTRGAAGGRLAEQLRHGVAALDPALEQVTPRPLAASVDETLAERRTPVVLMGLFSVVALVLAAVGIFGVVSVMVENRRRELAIRLALGATTARLLRMVVGHGVKLTVAGAVLGSVGSLAFASLIRAQLFEVSVLDPLTVAATIALLALVSLAACAMPALRVTRQAPSDVLKAQ